jgi:hypothetical protein
MHHVAIARTYFIYSPMYCILANTDCFSGLIPHYANIESWRKEMWGGRDPSQEEADQLYQCFEYEWVQAVESMLRHWSTPPTWY